MQHNKKGREEERVTLVVAVVTAESPTCTTRKMLNHPGASLSE